MWGIISFVWHNWHWILLALGLSIGLGYLAFILRNWRAAAAAAAIVGVMVAFGTAYKRGYDAKNEEIRREQALIYERRLITIEKLAAADRANADKAARRAQELQALIDATPANDKPAIDKKTAKRIGGVK